ncbi:MAG: hypothetical protein OHK0039_32510 [Bacteroidia bacterium]
MSDGYYTLIADPDRLRAFIDWLPALAQGEVFHVSLMARDKYATPGSRLRGTVQLCCFTATQEHFYEKIAQLACPLGSYTFQGEAMPQAALALYINPNPRSLERAAKQSLICLAERITQPYDGYNPHSEVLTEVQKAVSRKLYFDLDFDGVSPEDLMPRILAHIDPDCLHVLRTRGAFTFSSNWPASRPHAGQAGTRP